MQVRPWLPPGTPGICGKLAAAAERWSLTWFGDAEVKVNLIPSLMTQSHQTDKGIACGAYAWLELPDDTSIQLAAAALHLGRVQPYFEQDRKLLRAIGEECASSLCQILRPALGEQTEPASETAPSEGTRHAAVGWTIERPATALRLAFMMSEEGRVSAVRTALPRSASLRSLDSPIVALMPLTVELSAWLGRCKLSVSELASLSPGNVLVFDRDVDAALPLAINTVRAPSGACTVSRDEDTLVLEIDTPLAGNE